MKKSYLIYLIVLFLFFLSGCSTRIEYYNQKGNLNFLLNENNKAISAYSNVIKFDSKNVNALFGRGLSYLSQGNPESAILDFTKVIELQPKNIEAYRFKGSAKSDLSDYRGAIEDYSRVIEYSANDQLAYNWRIGCYKAMKNNSGIINDITKLIEIDPNNANAYLERAETYFDMQENEFAIKDLIKVLELDSSILYPHIRNGEINMSFQLRDWFDYLKGPKICKVLTNIIESNPNNSNTYVLRGLNKIIGLDKIIGFNKILGLDNTVIENDEKGATEDFSKAIQIDPKNIFCHIIKCTLLYEKWEDAFISLRGFERAKDNYSFNPLYEVNKEITEREIIKQKNIVNILENNLASELLTITNINPNNEVVRLYKREMDYEHSHPTTQTFNEYLNKIENQLIENQKSNISRESDLSKIRLQDTIKLVADYFDVEKKNPNFHFGNYQNGAELIRSLYFQKILKKLNDDIEKGSRKRDSYFLRGVIYLFFKNYEEAETDFTHVIQLDAKNIEAYCNRSSIKFMIHNYNGAIEDYSKIITIEEKNGMAYYHRGLINAIKLNQIEYACKDFSKAGELGYNIAYEAIKDYCR